MAANTKVRLHILVQGNVQGVGYRWFLRSLANRLGISGWVRNLYSGDVELEAQGEKTPLESFLKELRGGHEYAQVAAVKTRDLPVQSESAGFYIK